MDPAIHWPTLFHGSAAILDGRRCAAAGSEISARVIPGEFEHFALESPHLQIVFGVGELKMDGRILITCCNE